MNFTLSIGEKKMTEAELIQKRKKLFEKYESDRAALWAKWKEKALKSGGLDSPYCGEEKRLTQKFMEGLQALNGYAPNGKTK